MSARTTTSRQTIRRRNVIVEKRPICRPEHVQELHKLAAPPAVEAAKPERQESWAPRCLGFSRPSWAKLALPGRYIEPKPGWNL